MNTNTMINTTVESLFFRFWVNEKEVSTIVCPLRNTPHYEFAYSILEKVLKGEVVKIPENTRYEAYCKWENFCIGVDQFHSANIYYQRIAKWSKLFDIANNIPEVVQFKPGKYYIFDGTHRLAYITALIDLGISKNIIPIKIIVPKLNLPKVKGIGQLEEWIDLKILE